MQKEVVVAQAGFEDYFEFLKSKIENLEEEKQQEIDKLIEEIEKKYSNKFEVYKTAFTEISEVNYVEVPDEEATEETYEEPLEV